MDKYAKAIAAIVLSASIIIVLYVIWLFSGIVGERFSSGFPIAVFVPCFSAVFIAIIVDVQRKKEEEMKSNQLEV